MHHHTLPNTLLGHERVEVRPELLQTSSAIGRRDQVDIEIVEQVSPVLEEPFELLNLAEPRVLQDSEDLVVVVRVVSPNACPVLHGLLDVVGERLVGVVVDSTAQKLAHPVLELARSVRELGLGPVVDDLVGEFLVAEVNEGLGLADHGLAVGLEFQHLAEDRDEDDGREDENPRADRQIGDPVVRSGAHCGLPSLLLAVGASAWSLQAFYTFLELW